MAESQTPPASSGRQLRPWYFVIAFGLVSLFADMVYEGARAIIGPYLATLGASATACGRGTAFVVHQVMDQTGAVAGAVALTALTSVLARYRTPRQ